MKMQHPNSEPIDPLIRRQRERQTPTDFDAIIADQRRRQATSDALDGLKLDPGLNLPFNEVIGVAKDVGTNTVSVTTHIVEEDPNAVATRLSEAAWDSLPVRIDTAEFKRFAAALKKSESDKQSQPAQVALADVVVLEPVRLPEEQVAVEHTPTEIAS